MNRKLFRSKTEFRVAGVCGGIAEYLQVSPNLVRVLWVVLSLVTKLWLGLLLYVVLALVLPREGDAPGNYPSAEESRRMRSRLLVAGGVVLVMMGGWMLGSSLLPQIFNWRYLTPLLLVAAGIVLLVWTLKNRKDV